jgi:hypothetical protein
MSGPASGFCLELIGASEFRRTIRWLMTIMMALYAMMVSFGERIFMGSLTNQDFGGCG